MKDNYLDLPDFNNSFYDHNKRYELNKLLIFTFGSNLKGRHGKGAAKEAAVEYGAIYGIGEGIQGSSYAIPTKDSLMRVLPLTEIKKYVDNFLKYSNDNPNLCFYITPIGTGLAGYKHSEIAPMFKGVKGCWLPKIWKKYL